MVAQYQAFRAGEHGSYSRIIKVRHPCVPLASGTAHIIQMPSHSTAVERYVEDVLGDAHRLYTCVQDVICGCREQAHQKE